MFIIGKIIAAAMCAAITIVLVCGLLTACSEAETPPPDTAPQQSTSGSDAFCAPSELPTLDISAVKNGEDTLFAFTPSDFINRYNALYRAEKGENYLRDAEQWESFVCDNSPFSHSESIYYRFNYEVRVLTHPTISVYTPADDDRISGLTVDFDDHGYSAYQYEVYEEQCIYTLKALLNGCDDQTAVQICSDLNRLADDNFRTEKLSPDILPLRLYYKDSVGVFSHYTWGDYIHLCFVPVTQEYLDFLALNGTEIINVDNMDK